MIPTTTQVRTPYGGEILTTFPHGHATGTVVRRTRRKSTLLIVFVESEAPRPTPNQDEADVMLIAEFGEHDLREAIEWCEHWTHQVGEMEAEV